MAEFKTVLRDEILNHLYEPLYKQRNSEILQIAMDNNSLMNYFHLSFAYNGEFFNVMDTEGPTIRQKLHPSLEPSVQVLQKEYTDILIYERGVIHSYLNSVLSKSSYVKDYLMLFPKSLEQVVINVLKKQELTYIPNPTDNRLSPEMVEEFLKKYQRGYNMLVHRIAMNLIL